MKMSKKNEKDYLYLIWKAEKNGKRYIVGQLAKNGEYEFRYYEKEIREAIKEGFEPFFCFRELDKVYTDTVLFPVFASRLPDRKRKDIDKILQKYGLKEFDEYELLKKSGARLPIDNLEFIVPQMAENPDFVLGGENSDE